MTIAQTTKIIAKILRRRIERKTEDVLGMMRIKAEQTLEIEEELCICFIDWQKVFDRVNWAKLMQILKISGIDWCERILINKLYVDQRVKVQLDRGVTRSCRLEEVLDKDAVCHQFCSICTANALPRKLWMGLETSASEGKLFKL